MNILIIDSNILVSAIIKEGITREVLTTKSNINFVFPEAGLEEIYLHKQEILNKAGINKKEFDILLLRLLKYIRLIPLNVIADFNYEANKIMQKIDKEDVIFIAAALSLNCPIWSDDRHFQKQKEIKILTTKDILKRFCK